LAWRNSGWESRRRISSAHSLRLAQPYPAMW
jgi:hypothetical protein